MIEYDFLYNEVKNTLSEKRFKHSCGVVERALEYAKIYGEDEEKIKRAAIIHDIAKEIPKENVISYAEEIGVNLDSIEKENLALPHAKLGAEIAAQKYDFSEDMINAVRYHTTGKKDMTMLEKIIYLADATEPNRTYDDLDYYVNLCRTDINRAMYEVTKWVIEDLLSKDKIIHKDSVDCYNFYRKYRKQ